MSELYRQIILFLIVLIISSLNLVYCVSKTTEIASLTDTTRLIFTKQSVKNPTELKRKRCKRCHYSELDIELMNQNNIQKQKLKSYDKLYNYESNVNYLPSSSSHIKQPKTRDYNKYHDQGNQNEPHYEKEIIYVNIGDLVNLTCKINNREIDWYFMDRNGTTTVLSNGLQLLVSNSIQRDLSKNENDYDLSNFKSLVKYTINSDRETIHTLTVYVQGREDEGIYQCIDSISESPMKKIISVYLKNKARALYSVYGGSNSSSLISIYCLSHFLIDDNDILDGDVVNGIGIMEDEEEEPTYADEVDNGEDDIEDDTDDDNDPDFCFSCCII
ncbi:unnamed protein product [Brachionus calyciflorus]|uniref:Ig-like domain-containing protein n=1 Tax=Brachionus calyciflorus TaxID=104777 RepID=A0A813UD13_9BILA|nr:unnamed protein product [Brachionus calyciflorus]